MVDQELKLHRAPELLGQSKSEDDSALNVFTRSLAYSAAVGPSIAMGELADKVSSHLTKSEQSICSETVKNIAQMAGIQISQEQYAMGTAKWQAQQLGNAVGMLLPMTLIHKSLAPALPASAGLRSAGSGFAYGAMFTPTNLDSSSSLGDLLTAKAEKGLLTSITFGVMGASAARIENALRSSTLTKELTARLSEHATGHSIKTISGVLSAIPGGIVSAQTSAWEQGARYASLKDTAESVASLAYVGGVFGAANFFGTRAIAPAKSSDIQHLPQESKLEAPRNSGRRLYNHEGDTFLAFSNLSRQIEIYKEDRFSRYLEVERERDYSLRDYSYSKHFIGQDFHEFHHSGSIMSFSELSQKNPLIDRSWEAHSERNSLQVKYYNLYPKESEIDLRNKGTIKPELENVIRQNLHPEMQNLPPSEQQSVVEFFLKTDFPARRLADLVPLVDRPLFQLLSKNELRVDQQDLLIEKWSSLSDKTKELPSPALIKLLKFHDSLSQEQLASPLLKEYAELLHELDYYTKGYEHNLDDQFIDFYKKRNLSLAEAASILRSWKELSPELKLLPPEKLASISFNWQLLSPEQRKTPGEKLLRYAEIVDFLQLQENGIKALNPEFADWCLTNSPNKPLALFALSKWSQLSPELRNRLHEPELEKQIRTLQEQWRYMPKAQREAAGTDALTWAHLRTRFSINTFPEGYFNWYKLNNPEHEDARNVLKYWKDLPPAVTLLDTPSLLYLAERWKKLSSAQKDLEPIELMRQLKISEEFGKPFEKINPAFLEWYQQHKPEIKSAKKLEEVWHDLRTDLISMKPEELESIARVWTKLNESQKEWTPAELLHWSKYFRVLENKPQVEAMIRASESFRNWFEANGTKEGITRASAFLARWNEIPHELRNKDPLELSALLHSKFSQDGKNAAGLVRGLELIERSLGQEPEAARNLSTWMNNGKPLADWISAEATQRNVSKLDLLDRMTAISRMSRSFFLEDAALAALPREVVEKMLQMPIWKLETAISIWQNQVRQELGDVLFPDNLPRNFAEIPLQNDGAEAIKNWNETVNNREFLDNFSRRLDEVSAAGRDAALSSSSDPYTVVRQYFPDLEPAYINVLTSSLKEVKEPKAYVERIQPSNLRDALRRISFDSEEKQKAFEDASLLEAGDTDWIESQTGYDGRAKVAVSLISVFGKRWGRWLDLQTLKYALRMEADAQAKLATSIDGEAQKKKEEINVAQAVRGMSEARKAELFASLSSSQRYTAIHDGMWMLQKVKREHAENLSQWLFKYFDRDSAELGVVNKRWHRLDSALRTAPYRYQDVVEAAKSLSYEKIQNAEFAKEAAKWGVSEEHYPDYEKRFIEAQSTAVPFPLDKVWTEGAYTGRFLPRSDVRGPFLGQYSSCCQHPDHSAGNSAAWMGLEHPAAGYFVVEGSNKRVVAQSLVWKSDNGGLVFDSIEGKRPKPSELEAEQNETQQPDSTDQASTADQTGIERVKKSVSNIYDAVAASLIDEYSRISVGVGASAGKSIADFSRWQQTPKDETLDTPKGYSGYSDARNAQRTIAINENRTQLDEGTKAQQTWTRAGRISDMDSAKKIAEHVYPKGWDFLTTGDWNRVLHSREAGVIGYATMQTNSRYITDVAVLPEYGGKSVLLLRDILSEVKRLGGMWKANARASTSYELLKRAEALRWIQIDREIHRPGVMSGEDMYDVYFHVPARMPAVPG